jgi:hypothetical protein
MNRAELEALSREQLIELVLGLAQRVAELEAKLGGPPKTPANSSVPPAQGQKPQGGGRRRERRRKRRPGVARALDADPTRALEIRAACCPHCRRDLAAAAQAPARVYDHIEIPPIRPEVTRVTLMGGVCPHCARRFQGAPPAEMAPGSPFGANLRALALHLRFRQGIGFQRLAGLFQDVLGVKIGEGAFVNMVRAGAIPFAAQRARLLERLRTSPVLASDETGLRVAGQNHWLWVLHPGDAAVFRAAPTRGKRVLEDLLGEHRPDYWISDRYGGQKGFAEKGHQFCLAHLIRDARVMRSTPAIPASPPGCSRSSGAPAASAASATASATRGSRPAGASSSRSSASSSSGPPPMPRAPSSSASSPRPGATSSSSSPTGRSRPPTTNPSAPCAPASPSARSPAASAPPGGRPSTPISARCSRPPDDAPSPRSRPLPSPSRDITSHSNPPEAHEWGVSSYQQRATLGNLLK